MKLKNKSKLCLAINRVYFQEILGQQNINQGCVLELLQVFLDDVVQVKNKSNGVIISLLLPFIESLASAQDKHFRKALLTHVFDKLVRLVTHGKLQVLDMKQLETLVYQQAK